MKLIRRFLNISLAGCMLLSTSTGAHAVDYSFSTESASDYYSSTSYEDAYGSQYNYGGLNVVDYQIPELEYGSFSTTQTGVMERGAAPWTPGDCGNHFHGRRIWSRNWNACDRGYSWDQRISDLSAAGLHQRGWDETLRRQYRNSENPLSGNQHEGVGGRNKFQYAKRSGPLLVYFGLGRQCWRLWAQPRNQVCDRIH